MRLRQAKHPELPVQERYDDSFYRCVRQGVRAARRFERHLRARRMAVVCCVLLALGLMVGGGAAYVSCVVMPERERGERILACTRESERLAAAYSDASALREEARDAFASFDESYNLDSLAEVYDLEMPDAPNVDCSADPDGAVEGMESAFSAVNQYSDKLRAALGR